MNYIQKIVVVVVFVVVAVVDTVCVGRVHCVTGIEWTS